MHVHTNGLLLVIRARLAAVRSKLRRFRDESEFHGGLSHSIFAMRRYSLRDAEPLIQYFEWLDTCASSSASMAHAVEPSLVILSKSLRFANFADKAVFGWTKLVAWPLRAILAVARRLRRWIACLWAARWKAFAVLSSKFAHGSHSYEWLRRVPGLRALVRIYWWARRHLIKHMPERSRTRQYWRFGYRALSYCVGLVIFPVILVRFLYRREMALRPALAHTYRYLRRRGVAQIQQYSMSQPPQSFLHHLISWPQRALAFPRELRQRFFTIMKVQFLHANARRAAYAVLANHGELDAVISAFERLSHFQSKGTARERALDQLIMRLLPYIKSMEQRTDPVLRATPEGRRTLLVSVFVLSDHDLEMFERYHLPSILADGNLPAIATKMKVVWQVFTSTKERARLSHSSILDRVAQLSEIRFDEIPPGLLGLIDDGNRNWLREGLMLASFRLAAQMQASLLFVSPTGVYSRNFIKSLDRVAGGGPVVVLLSSFYAEQKSFCRALDASRDVSGRIAIAADELHSLALKHIHPASRRIIVDAEQLRSERLPKSRTLMWLDRHALAIRAGHHQPIFINSSLVPRMLNLSFVSADGSFLRISGILRDRTRNVHLINENDEIGYVEIGPSNLVPVPIVPVDQMIDAFWKDDAGYERPLFHMELRLPIVEPPAGSSFSARPVMREAFDTLFARFNRNRPIVAHSAGAADLLRLSDDIIRSELEQGGGPRIEGRIDRFRHYVRVQKFAYDAGDMDEKALSQLLVNFLRLGLLEELQILRASSDLPFDDTQWKFTEFCSERFHSAVKAGRQWRLEHENHELFLLSCVVWGAEYIDNFMEFNVRSMLAPGNLPSLVKQGRCKIFVTTNASGRARIEQHAVYSQTAGMVEWEFSVVPDALIEILVKSHLVGLFYLLYGMIDHIGVFYAQGARAHLFLIPVDSIVADGSLVNMANYRHQGYECCGGGNIVAESERFLPILRERFGQQQALAISTFDLASLAVANPHHYFISQVICRENADFGKYPRELFWPVQDGVEIHSCFIHPLFCSASAIQRYTRKHFANVDYGMIPRIFPDSRTIKILIDPKEAYINNFASGTRSYETTGQPFLYDDFVVAHAWTYPVQKSLFIHGQLLPCLHSGYTPYADVEADVAALWKRLNPSEKLADEPAASVA